MEATLSNGAIVSLLRGDQVDKPVLQLLAYKKLVGKEGRDSYRLKISDGLHCCTYAMLASYLNHLVIEGKLDTNSVFRANQILTTEVSEKKIIIITDLDIIEKQGGARNKIGSRTDISADDLNMASGDPKVPASESLGKGTAKQRESGVAQLPSTSRSSIRLSSMEKPNVGTVPIQDLNPYMSKCAIKARVTSKSEKKFWSKQRTSGKLFSIDLQDETGEIRMTGFHDAVDQFFDLIKVDECYIISKFSTKLANKQYNSLGHDYEISFTKDTQVMPCSDFGDGIPPIAFSFTDIALIENVDVGKVIDVIGVCKQRGDLSAVAARKDGNEFKKREIILVDRTKTEITATLWGKHAVDFNNDANSIVALKGVRVSDFNGKSLSTLISTTLLLNPEIKEAHELRGWYDNEGKGMSAKSLSGLNAGTSNDTSPWKIIREGMDVDQTVAESGYLFRSRVTVMEIDQENLFYQGCPNERCRKKVTENGEKGMRCEKCKTKLTNFTWRPCIQVTFSDESGSLVAACFADNIEKLFGIEKQTLFQLWNASQKASLDKVTRGAVWKRFTAKIKGQLMTIENETKIWFTIINLQEINHAEYSRRLLSEINEITE